MRIKVAKKIGFCVGVKRALDLTRKALKDTKNKEIYSFGQIIHNNIVVDELKNLGLKVVSSIGEVKDNSVLIFPSHGIPEYIRDKARKRNLEIIDATCPYVSNVHAIVSALKRQNYGIIIFGDKNHPEIKAIKSFAKDAFIVDRPIKLRDNTTLAFGIISQTTQAKDKYFDFVYHFLVENSFVKEVRVFNTICADVISRQKEVLALSKKVDAMFIIGGKNSANTKRLKALCAQNKLFSIQIEKASDLKNKRLKKIKIAGIASGASTPSFLVEDLVEYLKNIRHKDRRIRIRRKI